MVRPPSLPVPPSSLGAAQKPIATSDDRDQLHAEVATTAPPVICSQGAFLQAFSPNIVATANGSLTIGAAKIALSGPRLRASAQQHAKRHVVPSCAVEIEDGICVDQFDVQRVFNSVSSSPEKRVMTRGPSPRYPSSHPTR